MIFALSTTIGGCIALALGGGAAYIGGRSIALGVRSRRWPSYEGRVVSSHLHQQRRPNRPGHTYQAEIIYCYEDSSGETQRSNRVHCGFSGAGPRGGAASMVERYPNNKQIPVYYDPEQPSYTVLEPGVCVSSVIVTLMGFGFAVIGGLLTVGLIGPGS